MAEPQQRLDQKSDPKFSRTTEAAESQQRADAASRSDAQQRSDPKLGRATVARGRSIHSPHPTRRQVIGYDSEGKAIERPVNVTFGPGAEVELPPEDITSLRKSGYLVDPDTVAPTLAEGPNFTEQGGKPQAAR